VTPPGTTIDCDLSGIALRVRGLDEPLVREFAATWGPFLVQAPAAPWLTVDVAPAAHALPGGRTMRAAFTSEVEAGRARFAIDEGEIEIPEEGPATARLARGNDRWRFWGLANLLGAALAFRLPARPAALVHAAGIVVAGRAFLLAGPPGSGKSTWARLAREAGERVVGDDTVLVDGAGGALELLGSPIRAHEAAPLSRGRWPVAAILLPKWGAPARLSPARRIDVEARLAASLPYVAAGFGRDPRLDGLVPRLAPLSAHGTLTFAPDPSFLEALRSFRS